ncbi:hypothetical protein [Bacillus suaedaesalsae]|uniref:Uncharacterized protein n=1 Tax=Bacillus suaedaesalsae TaxID=2810349 RepID=A0ABS2DJ95_9BACI|nr:hypothetical protein [Bacillus suaedaesalsae]MBM6618075.1 hypothetical protein [Bacillus suaedaesalsae]
MSIINSKKIFLYLILCLSFIAIIFFVFFGSTSLESAIQKKWHEKIEVISDEHVNNLVLFKEKKTNLIVVNTYTEKYGLYSYNNDTEEPLISLDEEGNPKTFVKVTDIRGVGNVLWGYIVGDEEIARVDATFNSTDGRGFSYESTVLNNGILIALPKEYKHVDFSNDEWEIKTSFLDKKGKIIGTYKLLY